jgi:hypothetical protein
MNSELTKLIKQNWKGLRYYNRKIRKTFVESKLRKQKKYNELTVDDKIRVKNKLRAEQNYCCAICGTAEKDLKNQILFLDHNHESNKVRGLLCLKCNAGLGMFDSDDGIDLFCSAISYLRNTDNIE